MHLTSVSVDGAGDGRAVAVLDLERAALLGARRRVGSVVLALRAARRALAGGRGHPEVGGAGVEVDEEALAGRADRDRARPLLVIFLVRERLALALGKEVLRDGRELLDERALLEDVLANVGLQVQQVRTVLAAVRGVGISKGTE